MRGGTSKAVFLRGDALPADPDERDRFILALFGSPDPRQIDGLGGADLLTSKLAIIDPPTGTEADLDYTFAQISITEPFVDYDINCGNISAAVGAYAVDEGLVTVTEPTTKVRIFNTNTNRILRADVPIHQGRAAVHGDLAIDGVPGRGAPIGLDYSQTAGGVTGALLPTGNLTDTLDTAIGPVEVSFIDLANLCVFMSADSVGMTGTEGPDDLTDEHMKSVTAVKEAAAKRFAMDPDALAPIPAIVAAPTTYTAFGSGATVSAEEIDLVARVIGGRPPVLHKAYPGTTAACTAVAARLVGTTVHQAARPMRGSILTIGHTSGTMPIAVSVEADGDGWKIDNAAYQRTARRLARGEALLPQAGFSPIGSS
ncbi:MAG: 3-methylitaconate isomerase [Actinomycetia bacterium]|nr:3-methylitaconate isomerase [Actinomycetes bacterium]MCP5031678.1 3-methylitaconate isomerase [Actinomycetes bacterium]